MSRCAVYPRVCGATLRRRLLTRASSGLSPRVRGHRKVFHLLHRKLGSIPACAGPPFCSRPLEGDVKVYPRVCGATREDTDRTPEDVFDLRSIPACAGPPPVDNRSHVGCAVYPRVCGATKGQAWHRASVKGLSPRVRGHHTAYWRPTVGSRSIPACAGPPLGCRSGRT
mgnify:CR=1 FL=1